MATRSPAAETASRPDVDDVEDLLQVMQESDSLWLWRREGDSWRFLESRTREQLAQLGVTDATRQRTGGGDYKARIRQSNGQWREQRRFSIAGESRAVPSADVATSGTAAPAIAAPSMPGMPDWLKPLIGPILAALGAGMAARMFEKPSIDPMILRVLEDRGRRGETIDALELQRLLLEAERRGEDRGREIGKLASRGERVVVQRDSGVVEAVREFIPLAKDLVSANSRRDGENARTTRGALPSSTETTVPARPADIVPAWLRKFMPFKRMLLSAADNGTDAPAIAELIVKNADDATWAAMIEADQAGRLESDLQAAIPELQESETRQAFVVELLEDLRRDLHQAAPADEPTSDDAGEKKSAKKGAKKGAKRAAANG